MQLSGLCVKAKEANASTQMQSLNSPAMIQLFICWRLGCKPSACETICSHASSLDSNSSLPSQFANWAVNGKIKGSRMCNILKKILVRLSDGYTGAPEISLPAPRRRIAFWMLLRNRSIKSKQHAKLNHFGLKCHSKCLTWTFKTETQLGPLTLGSYLRRTAAVHRIDPYVVGGNRAWALWPVDVLPS